jgi:hypothetical protein
MKNLILTWIALFAILFSLSFIIPQPIMVAGIVALGVTLTIKEYVY